MEARSTNEREALSSERKRWGTTISKLEEDLKAATSATPSNNNVDVAEIQRQRNDLSQRCKTSERAAECLTEKCEGLELTLFKGKVEHKAVVEQMKKNHEPAFEQMEKEHELAIEQMKKAHEAAIEQVMKDCEEAIEQTKNVHEDSIAEMQTSHDDLRQRCEGLIQYVDRLTKGLELERHSLVGAQADIGRLEAELREAEKSNCTHVESQQRDENSDSYLNAAMI